MHDTQYYIHLLHNQYLNNIVYITMDAGHVSDQIDLEIKPKYKINICDRCTK